MREFTSSMGAKVRINEAPFLDALNLKNAIWREAAKAGVDFGDLKNLNDIQVSSVISLLLTVDSSDVVYNAVWPCMSRCLRNGEKITQDTFEDARDDFYEIMIAVIEENISPLVRSLMSGLKRVQFLKTLEKSSQKSK